MNDKTQIMATLREEFERWEELLAGLSEEQITTPLVPSEWSVKDEMAHLKTWQQRSIARLEAGRLDREPEFPQWLAGVDPEADDVDRLNAWIYNTNREKPWPEVHREWREGYLRFLELGQAIPEEDLLAAGRYAWMEGEPLSLILLSSHEHHAEHLETLLAWLRQHGRPTAG